MGRAAPRRGGNEAGRAGAGAARRLRTPLAGHRHREPERQLSRAGVDRGHAPGNRGGLQGCECAPARGPGSFMRHPQHGGEARAHPAGAHAGLPPPLEARRAEGALARGLGRNALAASARRASPPVSLRENFPLNLEV